MVLSLLSWGHGTRTICYYASNSIEVVIRLKKRGRVGNKRQLCHANSKWRGKNIGSTANLPNTGIEKVGISKRRGRGLIKKLSMPLLFLLLSEGAIKISYII